MMTTHWYQALEEADKGAAEALAPFSSVSPAPPAARSEGAEVCVRAWLANQYPCPNMAIVAGVSQIDLLEPLLDLVKSIRLLLVDRNLGRLANALNGVDGPVLGQAIRSGRLTIDVGETPDASTERFLRAADYRRVPEIRLLTARPLSDEETQMADDMTRPARELLRIQACDMSTRKRFGKEWQNQTLRNIPQIIRNPGVQSLFGRFAGLPALVVGAGPSLDYAIPYIKKMNNRFVVICVGRALLRYMRLVRIPPHLVVTGDGQQLVKSHFQLTSPNLPVVASCFSHPEVLRDLDRLFFMEMDAMGLPEWLGEKIGPRGEIFAGGNVSTAGLSLAVALGCNPVLMAGVDFSYAENGRTHAKGKYREQAQLELPPGQKYYDVPGNYRPTVKTNRQMMHYIDFTKDLIAHHPETTFINANVDGARIEGAQLVRPEEMGRFAAPAFDAPGILSEIYGAHAQDVDVPRFCDSLRSDIQSLRSLRTQCLDAGMVCNQMIMVMRRPASVSNAQEMVQACLAKLAPIDERLKNDPVMNLIESLLESASRLLAERMMTAEEIAIAPAVRSYWRWREFYKSVADACRQTEKTLAEVIGEIEVPPVSFQDPALLQPNPEPLEILA